VRCNVRMSVAGQSHVFAFLREMKASGSVLSCSSADYLAQAVSDWGCLRACGRQRKSGGVATKPEARRIAPITVVGWRALNKTQR
jgi:hypothetical protein